jgi:hypothetical protein
MAGSGPDSAMALLVVNQDACRSFLAFLGPEELAMLACTCGAWRAACSERELWESHYRRDFQRPVPSSGPEALVEPWLLVRSLERAFSALVASEPVAQYARKRMKRVLRQPPLGVRLRFDRARLSEPVIASSLEMDSRDASFVHRQSLVQACKRPLRAALALEPSIDPMVPLWNSVCVCRSGLVVAASSSGVLSVWSTTEAAERRVSDTKRRLSGSAAVYPVPSTADTSLVRGTGGASPLVQSPFLLAATSSKRVLDTKVKYSEMTTPGKREDKLVVFKLAPSDATDNGFALWSSGNDELDSAVKVATVPKKPPVHPPRSEPSSTAGSGVALTPRRKESDSSSQSLQREPSAMGDREGWNEVQQAGLRRLTDSSIEVDERWTGFCPQWQRVAFPDPPASGPDLSPLKKRKKQKKKKLQQQQQRGGGGDSDSGSVGTPPKGRAKWSEVDRRRWEERQRRWAEKNPRRHSRGVPDADFLAEGLLHSARKGSITGEEDDPFAVGAELKRPEGLSSRAASGGRSLSEGSALSGGTGPLKGLAPALGLSLNEPTTWPGDETSPPLEFGLIPRDRRPWSDAFGGMLLARVTGRPVEELGAALSAPPAAATEEAASLLPSSRKSKPKVFKRNKNKMDSRTPLPTVLQKSDTKVTAVPRDDTEPASPVMGLALKPAELAVRAAHERRRKSSDASSERSESEPSLSDGEGGSDTTPSLSGVDLRGPPYPLAMWVHEKGDTLETFLLVSFNDGYLAIVTPDPVSTSALRPVSSRHTDGLMIPHRMWAEWLPGASEDDPRRQAVRGLAAWNEKFLEDPTALPTCSPPLWLSHRCVWLPPPRHLASLRYRAIAAIVLSVPSETGIIDWAIVAQGTDIVVWKADFSSLEPRSEFPRLSTPHLSLQAHTDTVLAIAAEVSASPPSDETVVVTGGSSGSVGVWQPLMGRRIAQLSLASTRPEAVLAVCCSESLIAAGGALGTVCVWRRHRGPREMKPQLLLRRASAHEGPVRTIEPSTSTGFDALVSTDSVGGCTLWKASPRLVEDEEDDASSMGRRVAKGGGRFRWTVSGVQVTGHSYPVSAALVNAFGGVTGDVGGCVRVWDVEAGKEGRLLRACFVQPSSPVTAIAATPSRTCVLVATADGSIHSISFAPPPPPAVKPPPRVATDRRQSTNDARLAAATAAATIEAIIRSGLVQ